MLTQADVLVMLHAKRVSYMMLQVMASNGLLFFFDKDANFTSGFASALRVELLFGNIADGTDGSLAVSDGLYLDLCQRASPCCY
jgi:hypothetical protein